MSVRTCEPGELDTANTKYIDKSQLC